MVSAASLLDSPPSPSRCPKLHPVLYNRKREDVEHSTRTLNAWPIQWLGKMRLVHQPPRQPNPNLGNLHRVCTLHPSKTVLVVSTSTV